MEADIQQELYDILQAYGLDVYLEYKFRWKDAIRPHGSCRFDLVIIRNNCIYCGIEVKRFRAQVDYRLIGKDGHGTKQHLKYQDGGIPTLWISGEDDLNAFAASLYDAYIHNRIPGS
jgi:hypothetical protein